MRVDFVGFSRISEVACLVGRLSMDSDHSAMTQLRRGRWHWVNPNIPAKKVAKRIDVFVVQPVMTHPWVDWCTKKWYALSRFTWMRLVGHLCIDSVSSFKALLTRWFGAFVFFCVFFFSEVLSEHLKKAITVAIGVFQAHHWEGLLRIACGLHGGISWMLRFGIQLFLIGKDGGELSGISF